MAILNETACYAGEFLLSEANGKISKEQVTIVSGAGKLAAGTVLGKITASGKYDAYDNTDTTTGLGTAVAILYAPVDATSADVDATIVARHAEVIESKLTGIDANGIADLAAVQIYVR